MRIAQFPRGRTFLRAETPQGTSYNAAGLSTRRAIPQDLNRA